MAIIFDSGFDPRTPLRDAKQGSRIHSTSLSQSSEFFKLQFYSILLKKLQLKGGCITVEKLAVEGHDEDCSKGWHFWELYNYVVVSFL